MLYLETVERGPIALGAYKRPFFEKICERVPGAEYTLYFVQEELVAFNLLIGKQEAMVDKLFLHGLRNSAANTTCMSCPGLKMSAPAWNKRSLSITRARARRRPKRIWERLLSQALFYSNTACPMIDRLLVWQPAMTDKG